MSDPRDWRNRAADAVGMLIMTVFGLVLVGAIFWIVADLVLETGWWGVSAIFGFFFFIWLILWVSKNSSYYRRVNGESIYYDRHGVEYRRKK